MSEYNLDSTVLNDSTRTLFMVAERTGEKDVLSDLDALSYALYCERLDRCGGDLNCLQRVTRNDVYIRENMKTEAGITSMLKQLPQDIQLEVQNRAKKFIDDAKVLIEGNRRK